MASFSGYDLWDSLSRIISRTHEPSLSKYIMYLYMSVNMVVEGNLFDTIGVSVHLPNTPSILAQLLSPHLRYPHPIPFL